MLTNLFAKSLCGSSRSCLLHKQIITFRTCSSSSKKDVPHKPFNPNPPKITQLSLSEPAKFGTLANAAEKVDKSELSRRSKSIKTHLTTLSNGLRVVSDPYDQQAGNYCTIGVCIDSGSRYEVAFPSGISHFLEKLAFSSTQKFENKEEIQQRLSEFGGICDCQTSRDTYLYAASINGAGGGLEFGMELLGDAVLRPRLSHEEVQYAKMAVEYDLEDADMRPDQEPIMVEAVHTTAFANNTLGLPKLCPKENVNSINRDILLKYLATYHTPDRIVLAGVGVDHDAFVNLAEKYFVSEKPAWHEIQESKRSLQIDTSLAQYTGGMKRIDKDLTNASLGPTPLPHLAHLTLGLESFSHQHDDFIALCVMNTMMGGGGSFSAGGPGKGMYARMYLNVLNQHYWMYSCQALHHTYADSGVFCISASAPPEHLNRTMQIMVRELTLLTENIGKEEFDRAKKQLQSMLLMNLESRPVIFEDMARQILAQGERKSPEYYIEEIKRITDKDINRVAQKLLATRPTVVGIGQLDDLPEYKDIELGLTDRKRSTRKGFSIYR